MRDTHLFDGEVDQATEWERGFDRDGERESRPRFRKPYKLSSYRPMGAGVALSDIVDADRSGS